MSSRRWIESARRWFLGLPQLQKTLVFGGLGLLSGWVTTGAIHGTFLLIGPRRVPVVDMLLFLATCTVGPGLAFGVVVAGPIYLLRFGTIDGWMRSLFRVIILHPLAFIVTLLFAGFAVASPQTLPVQTLVAVVFTGGVFGYLLTSSCVPSETESDQVTRNWMFWVMGTTFGLIVWGEQRFHSGIPALPSPLATLFRTALVFVTVHTAAAVCLSIRGWPELPKVAPPPLDDSATLPP